MAQRIQYEELVNKAYDHVLISMGAIEHDARLLNIVYTLNNEYSKVLLIGLYTPNWWMSCKDMDVDVLMLDDYSNGRMYKLWIDFYSWLSTFNQHLKSRVFWAMDLYSLPFVVRLSAKSNARSIYDSREVYSALGESNGHPVKQKIISYIEKRYIKRVGSVFTSGPLDSRHLSELYNMELPEVVMNLPRFHMTTKTQLLRRRFNIPEDKKIILYQGVIHQGRGLMKFVRSLDDMPDIVFCLLGSKTPLKEKLREEAVRRRVNNRLFFMDPVPYSELLEWTSSADLGLCYIEPLTLSLEYALPNKLFEYAMAGVPPIISDLPQMTPYVQEYECGIVIPYDATVQYIRKTVNQVLHSKEYDRMKKNTRGLSRVMNWERQKETVLKIAGCQ